VYGHSATLRAIRIKPNEQADTTITHLQELLDCQSSSRWNALGMSRNQGRQSHERIIPCHIYGPTEIIDSLCKQEITDQYSRGAVDRIQNKQEEDHIPEITIQSCELVD